MCTFDIPTTGLQSSSQIRPAPVLLVAPRRHTQNGPRTHSNLELEISPINPTRSTIVQLQPLQASPHHTALFPPFHAQPPTITRSTISHSNCQLTSTRTGQLRNAYSRDQPHSLPARPPCLHCAPPVEKDHRPSTDTGASTNSNSPLITARWTTIPALLRGLPITPFPPMKMKTHPAMEAV